MTAFAAVTGKNWDGDMSATPAAATGSHVYTPTNIDQNNVAVWTLNGAVYDANQRLSFSVRRPTKGSQVIRVQLKLAHPVMDAVDTTLKIGECLANVEFVFPKRATQALREGLVGDLIYIMNQEVFFVDAIGKLESVY